MNPYMNGFSPNNYANSIYDNQLNRLNQLQQMQNQQYSNNFMQNQQMQQTQQIPPTNFIKPVTSIEEVRGVTPNFDGSKLYFEDVTNNKMYVKYLGFNGLPIMEVFSKDENSTSEATNSFVSKEEFEQLRAKMEQYESVFNQLIGGSNNES